ncbi:MAG: pseudouridine synthase [Fimbriimonadaceae bacterium]
MKTTERLHKRVAASGICSRRTAETMISEGRVMVNGEMVTAMGIMVSDADEIHVDGKSIGRAKVYTLIMNKPVGIVTSLSDPQGRPTVKHLLPDMGVQLKPVGRLDMDSEGLIIFTNDGELAQRLTHPRHKVEKEYEVVVMGRPSDHAVERLRKGVHIEDGMTAPAQVELPRQKGSDTTLLRITIFEGRKRQIRQMCEVVGHPVVSLKRVRIGPLRLYKMPRGSCRMLSQVELGVLRKAVGLA